MWVASSSSPQNLPKIECIKAKIDSKTNKNTKIFNERDSLDSILFAFMVFFLGIDLPNVLFGFYAVADVIDGDHCGEH